MPGDQASSPPPTSGSESQPPLPVIVKVSLPASFGPKHKMVKYTTHDQIWTVKMQLRDLLADVAATQSDLWNWGILDDNCEPIRLNSLPGFKSVSVTKQFMDDGRTFGDYSMQGEVSVTFCPRYRISPVPEKEAAKVNTKKYQKKFIEYFTTRQLDKLKDLLSKGFDLNFHADDGDTPLVLAVRADDKSLIKLFAVDHGAHLDFRTPCGKTPLHWACHLGKYAAARALLAHGAWHSAPEYPSCASPLHSAATAGQAEILAQLLQARADPNVADRANKTPLHAACTASVGPASKGAEQCMRMLIEYGARLDALNDAGNTPLHACAANNAVACARELLKCGANKDLVSSSGKTAHQVALLATNFELAEVIASFTPDQVEKLPSPNPKMYADYEAPPAASAAENPTGSEPVASGMANLSISPSVDNDGQGGSYSPGFTASPESGAASYLTMSMQPDPMASHFGSVSGTQGFMPNGYNTHHQAMDLPPPPPLPPMDYGSLPPPPPLPTGFQSMPGYSSDETSGLPPLPPPPPLSSSDMHYQHGYEGASKIHQPRSLGGTMSGYGSVRMWRHVRVAAAVPRSSADQHTSAQRPPYGRHHVGWIGTHGLQWRVPPASTGDAAAACSGLRQPGVRAIAFCCTIAVVPT
ncbi:ankyrin repeat-containing domain protein [Blastocladiella britannica]|nr:ankyrin repeat-containing domain protein [Blastocladiella britannica]